MKKYLFIALAALGFAACADKIDDHNTPIHNGELEESYIAINLMAADNDTRAAEDTYGYEEGTTAERAVKTAYFFFFDAEGNPFNVAPHENGGATTPGDGKNHLSLTLSTSVESQNENISDISNAVLVLNTYKGVYPSQIVAVINWTPDANTAYSLTALHEMLATLGNDTDGYVMSNSVYMDGANKMIDAVPLTAANIKTTADDAKAAPVEIYVERIAAKVVVTANNTIFDTEKETTPVVSEGETSTIQVFVKLHGWELYNDYATSNLLKNIANWDIATLGLTWNDIPYFRCYWAQSQDTSITDSFSWEYTTDDQTKKGFPTTNGFAVAEADDNYKTRSTYTYCGENTNGEDLRTKVILKGQLVKADSQAADGYSPLELARWYGTEYAGNEALRIAVANSLKYTLFYSYTDDEGDHYKSIEPDDIQIVAGKTVGAEAYEVGFQLSTDGQAKTWWQYNSTNGYVVFGDNGVTGDNVVKTNEYLKSVEPALLYTNGMTYYYVDIEHLGTAAAKYGVVRNHVYQIDINSIKGYGSPIYDGEDFVVDKPEYPTEDEASYVAARINVLSWKVVKQGVNIEQ